MSNISMLNIRIGSGTCTPPAPTDPPFQLFVTDDCISYKNWRSIYSQKSYINWIIDIVLKTNDCKTRLLFYFRILPNIESITVPISIPKPIDNKVLCLKIEQAGDRFAGGSSWFIDDFSIIRSRKDNDDFFDTFSSMKPSNWHQLLGGHLKVCFK